jgi:hypothetical protein
MNTLEINETKSDDERHFVAVSGQFYVAHWLTRHRFHAAITLGNAPNVDIMLWPTPPGRLPYPFRLKRQLTPAKSDISAEKLGSGVSLGLHSLCIINASGMRLLICLRTIANLP